MMIEQLENGGIFLDKDDVFLFNNKLGNKGGGCLIKYNCF